MYEKGMEPIGNTASVREYHRAHRDGVIARKTLQQRADRKVAFHTGPCSGMTSCKPLQNGKQADQQTIAFVLGPCVTSFFSLSS